MAQRSKGLAGLLAFLLGVFGAHRFYLNREKGALAYFVPTALLAMAIVYTGTRSEWGGWEDPLHVTFLALWGVVLLIMLVGWSEAIRFWTMHPDRFRVLYVEPVQPTHETTPQGRVPERAPRKKSTAGLLAILLGWIGVQRFYIRRPLSGVLAIVLFLAAVGGIVAGILLEETSYWAAGAALAGLLALLGILDGMRLLMMRRRVFEYRYGRKASEQDEAAEWS